MRVPTARMRTLTRVAGSARGARSRSGFLAWRARRLGARGDGFDRRRIFPELLESVELANARQHHVHDDVGEIDEHPFTFARAFDAHRAEVVLLGELHHAIGNGLDVAV